jgi:hypothetical protein
VTERVCDRCGGLLDETEGVHEIVTTVYRVSDGLDLEIDPPIVRVYCHACGFVVLRERSEVSA